MITKVFVSVFGVGAIVDLLLAMLGMAIIFQASGVLSYVICAVFSFAFLGLRLCTERIVTSKDPLYRCLTAVLVAFIFMNLFATAGSLAAHILLKQPLSETSPVVWSELWDAKTLPVLLVFAFGVLYIVASPVFLSFLLRDYLIKDEVEDEDDGPSFVRQTTPASGSRIK